MSIIWFVRGVATSVALLLLVRIIERLVGP